jgi:hypothetical protein
MFAAATRAVEAVGVDGFGEVKVAGFAGLVTFGASSKIC